MAAWMPLYVGDYLKKTLGFSTFQHGCYVLLILAYWENGGPLPNDPHILANICKTTPDKLARYGKSVLAKFTTKDGLLCHQRIDFELSRSCERIAAGKAAANARWHPAHMQSTVTPTKKKEESKILQFGNGKGRGPEWNLSKFQKRLAEEWGAGWEVVGAAADPTHPRYGASVEVCKKIAAANGKGWPHLWPKP